MPEELPTDVLLDSLPDGVVVADRDGIVTHVNLEARRLLGDLAQVGRRLEKVLQLQDLDGRDWFVAVAPYTGLTTRRLAVEESWHLADGTELLVTARFVRPRPTRPVERVTVSLRSARSRERLDRERSDLVATVAHELRSPLTGVKGFTGTLLERWDRFSDDQKKLIMQSVHNDTDRLTRLIADLLEVARIDTGRLTLMARPFDAIEEMDHIRDSVRAGSGREILLASPSVVPEVHADPDRFAQVMTNIVDNAVRHGDGTVRINAAPVARDGREYVEIVVEDQGTGISPEIRTRVFTKFWKHGHRGGSGLGMYIAHGLVHAHGGTIDIGEAADGGARITVLWPTGPLLDEQPLAG
jgi:signal transduction histidine kinase